MFTRYRVCADPLEHSGNGRIYRAGEIIPLDHLTPEKIDLLVSRGLVELIEPAETPDQIGLVDTEEN